MIERRAEADGIRSAAWYSPCEAYRYGLERRWGTGGALLFVMLNPSTATEEANDPTIARCQRRAQQLGFGAMRIANLFGYRATHPRDLARAEAPVGPENDLLLRDWAQDAAQVLAAWGVHGALLGRGPEVAAWLPGDVRHLWHTPSHRPGRDIPLSETYSDSVASLPAPRRQALRTAPDALRRHGTLTAGDRVDPRAAGARPTSAPLRRVDNGETALPLPAPPAHAPSATDLGSFDPAHDQIVILSELPAPQGIAFRPAAADPGVREIVAGGQVLATLRAAELPEIIEVVWVMPDPAPSGRPI